MTTPEEKAGRTVPEDVMLILGEMRGQLREIVHTINNASQKIEALSMRVAALEAESHRRSGERGVVAAIIGSRALGWVATAAIGIYAFLAERVG